MSELSDPSDVGDEQSRLLRDALLARADAEAAQVRADDAREEAEHARRDAELARIDAERGRARIGFLAEAGRRMAESIDWESTLRAVVRSAVPAIADWTSLSMAGPGGRLSVLAVAHRDPEREALAWELVRRHPAAADPTSGAAGVIRTGRLELYEDVSPEQLAAVARDEEHLRLLQRLDVRHAVIAPLQTPAGVIGALTFVLGESGRRFTPEDLELIFSLAARATLHIHNSRLYTERSHIAQTLEASLRPRALPAIPGVELAARYRPAGDHNEVGGDFYDVFPSGDNVWTAFVGDVSGKGPEAAALTALARHTLRAASLVHDDPVENLALLNRALDADSTARDFCTVVYARLCPGPDGRLDLRFANGGHPAPLVLRADGTVARVEQGRGTLVGAIPDACFREATLQLLPGDLLVLYTDGVTEVRTSDPEFGERELASTLAACAGLPAEEVVATIERHAVELQGGRPRDDIALVAIKAVTGAGGSQP